MNRTRLWTLGSVIAMLALAAGGWFLGISPQLDAAALATSDLETVENQNFSLETDLSKLKTDFEDLEANQLIVDQLRIAVPDNDKLDTFLGQINAMAETAGVTVIVFTSSDSLVFVPSVEAAPTVPAGIDSTNFLTTPISLTVSGNRDQIMAFVGLLQTGPRLMLVSQLSLAISEEGTSGQISGLLFVYLDEPLILPAEEGAATAP